MYTKTDFSFSKLGNTLILNFPHREGDHALQFILKLSKTLKIKYNDQLEDVTHSFNSINLFFKGEFDPHKIHKQIFGTLDSLKIEKNKKNPIWKLPVCFADEFTSDLFDHFRGNQQQVNTYLEQFMKLEYCLFFYGFLPGFPYLSGLSEELIIPRKISPNRLTPKGSLAVGASQVGIYPQDSPGGWHVIGNCPIPIIDFELSPPNFIEVGDRIRFFEISEKELQEVLLAIQDQKNHPLINQVTYD
tara:strand:+ start:7053 stop:7787 length:735 start_codon:yes stop_codon:yes gene_type:complete